ncbi:hypothetical protein A6R68_07288, partial [Neotoma lepida]
IKVSVSSGGDCIRTYKPEIKKGSYNNIIVNVKTPVADNLLFYLGSAKFKADAVRVITFTGCMGETYFDNKPIGLWNFREKEGDCKGCTVSAWLEKCGFVGTAAVQKQSNTNAIASTNVYTVSFPKPGFVELAPVPIDVGTEINLSFSTKNESGLILLGSGGTPTPPRRKRRQTGQIKIVRVKQEGTLYVDDASNQTISPKKADILDVVGMLYVGGLPINYTTRRIGPVTYSLDGCVRNLYMEQAPVNLDQPTSSFHVGTCFANAQRGTYFDGTGFAKA